jgi:uncharacterized protein (TIGR00369 family)
MARQTSFKHYDEGTAERFVASSTEVGGLPSYLGVRFVEMTAGRLVATMTVRDELLTPFKTLHGGVMAGLVDHVLGCVLYPLMPRGQWAATTEFKLNYLAPVFGGAELRAESTVLSLKRQRRSSRSRSRAASAGLRRAGHAPVRSPHGRS